MTKNLGILESAQGYPKEDFLNLVEVLEEWTIRQKSLLKLKTDNLTEKVEGDTITESQGNDIDFRDFETLELPRWYFQLLESKLQELSQKDKSRMSDDERDRVFKLFLWLKSLAKEVYPSKGTELWVKRWTIDILRKYSFLNFTSLKQFEGYIEDNSENTSWNSDMLWSFLSKLYVFIKWAPDEQKNRIIQSLFDIPWVKSCSWTKEMLKWFWGFVHWLKSDFKWAVLRRFNALPNISKISEIWRVWVEWKWLVLAQRSEWSWTMKSHLWWIPWRVGPLARWPNTL